MAPGLPTAMDRPHFIGIGGAGMSGIAKILAQRGAKVAGSDAKDSPTADALRAYGATVHIGHAAGHLADDASCVVVSSAIREDNPADRTLLTPSAWVALSRDPAQLKALAAGQPDAPWEALDKPAPPAWTDDYASILPYVRWDRFLGKP